MKKKIAAACIILLLMAAFILMPVSASKLYIRIYFDEIQGEICALYYALDDENGFSQEQCISSAVDYDRMMVEFALEPSLEGRITSLRLDFPDEPQFICIKNITVSNDGMIQREYNPCDFFARENIVDSNDIDAVSLITARARVYINAFSDDPYLILSYGLCGQIMDCYRHYTPTKLAVCVFLLGCFFLARLNIFKDNTEGIERADVSVFCGTQSN